MINKITQETMNMSYFFKTLKSNFSKIILVNVIFSIPLLIYGAVLFVLSYFVFKQINIFLLSTIIIFATLYSSGLCKVTKDIALGYNCDNILSTFTKACKENAGKFLLMGIFNYIFFILQWFAFNIYWDFAATNSMFYFPLVLSIIMCIVYLFLCFYIPTMTVTLDLKFIPIIKNGLILAFVGIKRNFFLILCFIFIACILASVCMLMMYPIIIIIFFALLSVVMLFALLSYLVNFVAYVNIYKYVIKPFEDANKKAKASETVSKSSTSDMLDKKSIADTPDEYVFYNGRMIKKSVLLAQQENNTDK